MGNKCCSEIGKTPWGRLMRKKHKVLFSMAMVAGIIALGVTPVQAADLQERDVWNILSNLTNRSSAQSTAILSEVANASPDASGVLKFAQKLNEIGIQISPKPGDAIQIQSPLGHLALQLPFSKIASNSRIVSSGIVEFDNNNGSSSVPVIKRDGSLQVTTVIQKASAPTRFDYQFKIDGSAKILKYGNGLVLFNDGKFAGAVAPAWAKDADGTNVPTHYEVIGTTITQVVEHQSAKFAYPIVADPWVGFNLFSSIYISPWATGGLPVVNLNLSPWGWLVYTGVAQGGLPLSFGAGQAILDTAGWDEAWGKGGSIRAALDKPSQRQQFSCHALGAIAAGEWNLEKFRLNRINGDWAVGVAVHHCNWTTADRY
jgi:hypothetical protein